MESIQHTYHLRKLLVNYMSCNGKEFQCLQLTSCRVMCEAMVCQVCHKNQCMRELHYNMVHTFAIDSIAMPYFHWKCYTAIHGSLHDKFNLLQGSHWVTNYCSVIIIGVL